MLRAAHRTLLPACQCAALSGAVPCVRRTNTRTRTAALWTAAFPRVAAATGAVRTSPTRPLPDSAARGRRRRYLCSLQDLTDAPFRVVDEINQGMDKYNERNVRPRSPAACTPRCTLVRCEVVCYPPWDRRASESPA